MTRRIVITGSSGMLGKDIVNVLFQEKAMAIFGLDRIANKALANVKQIALDLTDFGLLKKIIEDIDPEIIIHCAANVNVDDCEKNKKYTYDLHVGSTDIFASYKPDRVKFVYISTDSVFDGKKGGYNETSKPRPLNYYARTKFEGERVSFKRNSNAIAIRTNIYGFNSYSKKSLAEWAIENLKKGNTINGFTDTVFNPVYTKQLARIIGKLLIGRQYAGILNVGCSDYISKYIFLLRMAEVFGFKRSLIKESSTEQVKMDAKRPKDTTLNINRLKNMFNKSPSLESGLKELRDDYYSYIGTRTVYEKD